MLQFIRRDSRRETVKKEILSKSEFFFLNAWFSVYCKVLFSLLLQTEQGRKQNIWALCVKAATFSVPFSFLCLIPNTLEIQFPPLAGTATLKIASSKINTAKKTKTTKHFNCFTFMVSTQNCVLAKAEIHKLLKLLFLWDFCFSEKSIKTLGAICQWFVSVLTTAAASRGHTLTLTRCWLCSHHTGKGWSQGLLIGSSVWACLMLVSITAAQGQLDDSSKRSLSYHFCFYF